MALLTTISIGSETHDFLSSRNTLSCDICAVLLFRGISEETCLRIRKELPTSDFQRFTFNPKNIYIEVDKIVIRDNDRESAYRKKLEHITNPIFGEGGDPKARGLRLLACYQAMYRELKEQGDPIDWLVDLYQSSLEIILCWGRIDKMSQVQLDRPTAEAEPLVAEFMKSLKMGDSQD